MAGSCCKAPLLPARVGLHEGGPGQRGVGVGLVTSSPVTAPSLRCGRWKSQPQRAGWLPLFFPPEHTRPLSLRRGQGRAGHFGSPLFSEPALAWEQSPLAPGGFTVWVHLLALSGSFLPFGMRIPRHLSPVTSSHLLQEAVPLCLSLSLPPSHCSEVLALAPVTGHLRPCP